MKRTLRILALIAGLAAVAVWLALGANRGWTHTLAPVKTLDPVTGITGIDYRNQFSPGLDFLAVALLGAAGLAGASLFFRNHQPQIKP